MGGERAVVPSRRAVIAGALQRSRWVVVSYDVEKQSTHVDQLGNSEEGRDDDPFHNQEYSYRPSALLWSVVWK